MFLVHAGTILAPVQATFVRVHGRYWQGLPSHAFPPKDGTSFSPTELEKAPHDQQGHRVETGDPERPFAVTPGPMTWRTLALDKALAAAWPMSLRVDVYNGPSGHGYTVTGTIDIGGALWARTLHVGPELWREHDWQEVSVEIA